MNRVLQNNCRIAQFSSFCNMKLNTKFEIERIFVLGTNLKNQFNGPKGKTYNNY